MKRMALTLALLAVVTGGSVLAYGITRPSAGRPDCLGTVACPITGDEVCKDRCPLLNANRSDCPGQIACPITGELVCRDECPLAKTAGATDATPACCRAKP